MLAPDEVAQMVRLHQLGLEDAADCRELGCSRNMVKRYLAARGWVAIRPARCSDPRAGSGIAEKIAVQRG